VPGSDSRPPWMGWRYPRRQATHTPCTDSQAQAWDWQRSPHAGVSV